MGLLLVLVLHSCKLEQTSSRPGLELMFTGSPWGHFYPIPADIQRHTNCLVAEIAC